MIIFMHLSAQFADGNRFLPVPCFYVSITTYYFKRCRRAKKSNVNIVIIICTSDKRKTNRSCVSCSLINKRLKCYTYKLLIAFSTLLDIIIHSFIHSKINYVHQPKKLTAIYIYYKWYYLYTRHNVATRYVIKLSRSRSNSTYFEYNFFFITSGQNIIDYTTV